MHDMDRVRLEAEGELGDQEQVQEQEQEQLMMGPFPTRLDELGEQMQEQLMMGPPRRELELATEVLEVTSERELEQFLGDLMTSATRAASQFVNSPTGQALGDVLKDAARKALPVVGQAIGDYVAPGSGGDLGRRVGAAASQLFEMELEGLSNEDKEFELARRYVQFARAATRAAARRPPTRMAPHDRARWAAARAARVYAPGLLSLVAPDPDAGVAAANGASVYTPSHRPASGRWERRGRVITVYL